MILVLVGFYFLRCVAVTQAGLNKICLNLRIVLMPRWIMGMVPCIQLDFCVLE